MVNTALPEDLESMGGSSYIHDALQLRWAVKGVEEARMVKYVEMSMLKRGWKVGMEEPYANRLATSTARVGTGLPK